MNKLHNKVAVVTGASKGIGAGIAKQLAAAGAKVVVNYATAKEGAEKVVADITALGGQAIAVQANVAQETELQGLFDTTVNTYGPIDILVNNAGVYRFGTIDTVSEAAFTEQFNTNVLGLLLATKSAVNQFNPKGGSIINIGSVVSTLGLPGTAIYTATKGAVDAITRVLAKELGGRGIRVNALNPGMVETEGAHSAGIMGSEMEQETIRTTPLGRIGQPDDIADIAVFLASDDARWLTGETLLASGGVR